MTAPKETIDALRRRLAQAHLDRDADAVVACYTAEARIFDLAPPLGRRGLERQTVADWFATWDGPIALDDAEEHLDVAGSTATLTALTRMRGGQGGRKQDLWFRSTVIFRAVGRQWLIAHHHTSVPFYMDGSLAAALDLTPNAAATSREGAMR